MLDSRRKSSLDPRRNSFCNLIDFVATGVDVPMEDGEATPMDVDMEEGDNNPRPKKDKKKTKKEEDSIIEDDGEKKSKKKEKKKKKKRKKRKEDDDTGESDVELDSDDDLSLGSVPTSSSSDDDDDEEESNDIAPALSKGVSRRASVATGLKGFQKAMNFQNPPVRVQQPAKANSKRRDTLGAALKGFQIDVGSLQETKSDDGLENMTDLSKNLPTLSIAGVKQPSQNNHSKRRQSAFDVFLKDTGKDKDGMEG